MDKKEQYDPKTWLRGRGAAVDAGAQVPCPACTGEPVRSLGIKDVMCHHCGGTGYTTKTDAAIIKRKLKAQSEDRIGEDGSS